MNYLFLTMEYYAAQIKLAKIHHHSIIYLNKKITWGNCLICIIYRGINQENFLQWICLLGKVFIYFLSPVTLHHLQWIMYG